ncbi:ribonuclease H2 subunit A-like protein [Coemansia reversa NRRL 1564]|uniref:Ribonuclease n=1 Tax=Coemansia reversa (strain ATCC 12441 / NRRL 1564) TaxID=763665 RepID=A0A2G5BAI5_COERN|nr:ribonuclease H2 subunit A-like protein [Coemansia reversa NRRL 1564]|eukprot:PIA16028.1 ribonuclease H2 subunit A-like protein [Coemansia reversa NRRL 1564]
MDDLVICIPVKYDGFVLGVDEAGRGPVLGPMVYATCFCRESYYEQLSSIGFADSKQLTEEQRERLFLRLQTTEIRKHTGWSIRCISPQDISQSMLRRVKTSLNAVAHDATIQLIQEAIERGISVRKVFIDTVGPPVSYQKKLQDLFPQIEITVAKKADSLYPIVSAASICAKVTRDKHLENWVFVEPMLELLSKKYGSGYPADPNTIKWLRDSLDPVFGYPGIIRFSWSTCKKLLDECAVRVSWPDDENDAPKSAKLTGRYFIRSNKDTADLRQRSKFFNRHKAIVLASSL